MGVKGDFVKISNNQGMLPDEDDQIEKEKVKLQEREGITRGGNPKKARGYGRNTDHMWRS